MLLRIPWPSDWEVTKIGSHRTVETSIDGTAVRITIGPLEGLPDYQVPWRHAVLHSDLPQGAIVSETASVDEESIAGWPIRVIDATVTSGEARLVVFYHFLEWGSFVLVRAKQELPGATRARLLEILRGGRPEWSTPASLSQLLADLHTFRRA